MIYDSSVTQAVGINVIVRSVLIGQKNKCDIKGYVCLGENRDRLLKLMDSDNKTIPCDCISMCESLKFQVVEEEMSPWFVSRIELN